MAYNGAWSKIARQYITGISKGIAEVLAGLAEPTMRYATVYLALATSLSAIKIVPVYMACQGIVIAAPEFVLFGAIKIAEDGWRDRKYFWSTVLFIVCVALTAIMIATFVDIFLVAFNDTAIKALNFARCLVAAGFTLALNKLDDEAPATPVQVAATPANQQQIVVVPAVSQHPMISDTATPATSATAPMSQQDDSDTATPREDVAPSGTTTTLSEDVSLVPTATHDTEMTEVERLEKMLNVLSTETVQGVGEFAAQLGLLREGAVERQRAKIEEKLRVARQAQPSHMAVDEGGAEAHDTTSEEKLNVTLEALQADPAMTDAELAGLLGFKRPASARFWRLKAMEMLNGATRHRDTPIIEENAQQHDDTTPRHDSEGNATRHRDTPAKGDIHLVDVATTRHATRDTRHASEDVAATAKGDNDTAAQIAKYRERHPLATPRQIAVAIEKSERTVQRHLKSAALSAPLSLTAVR